MNLPMLLTFFGDHEITYPLWAERKIDGVRCFIVVDDAGRGCAYSRNGNVLHAAQPLADVIAGCSMRGVYDGELDAGTWSKTCSAVKRQSPAGLRYVAFDHLGYGEWIDGGTERSIEARRMLLEHLADLPGIEVIESRLITTDADMEKSFNDALAKGWEGLVAKRPGSPYTCGVRSRDWQKLKPCREDSCESE